MVMVAIFISECEMVGGHVDNISKKYRPAFHTDSAAIQHSEGPTVHIFKRGTEGSEKTPIK